MNRLPLKINYYLIKSFSKKLLFVLAGISLLTFVINLFDVFNKAKDAEVITTFQVLTMAALHIPAFIADISIFIIMLTTMITLSSLSSKSEITVMRASGLSLWKILAPIISMVFLIGLIFVFIFMPITIYANKSYTKMEKELIRNETRNSFAPKNGIWLKQDNLEKEGEEIRIRADKIYRNNVELENVAIWFFNKDNQYYKKIDAKNMFLEDGKWHAKNLITNDPYQINKEEKEIEIPTNLEPDFILQKIVNNFEDVKLFSIISLPKLISNLEASGFSSRKFKVYFHFLLNQPFLFVCMSLIAAYFSINNIRNRNNMMYIVFGIMFGLITYISLNIINALGASGMLPAFMSTWIVTLLFLAAAILLMFKKETL